MFDLIGWILTITKYKELIQTKMLKIYQKGKREIRLSNEDALYLCVFFASKNLII